MQHSSHLLLHLHVSLCMPTGAFVNRRKDTSVQVVPLLYPLQMGILPLTYPLRVPLTLKAWEGVSVRGSY